MAEEREDTERLSPQEFRKFLENWHQSEIVRVRLQSAEAGEIMTDYVSRKLTQDQALDRLFEYGQRWGESPLEAINHPEKMSDNQVMKLLRKDRSATPER